MELSTENIEKAVHQFYVDAANQQEINKWLMAAQISPQAWVFSGQLLAKDKVGGWLIGSSGGKISVPFPFD